MSDKVVAVILARTWSKRFPAKCLQPIHGKTAILRVADRIRFAPIDDVIIAIPEGSDDNHLAAILSSAGLSIYRGSSDDAVSRLYGAAKQAKADIIILGLMGDTPFAYMGLVKSSLEVLKSRLDLDCVRAWNPDYAPSIDLFAGYAWPVRMSFLEKTEEHCQSHKNLKEHPTLFFQRCPERFNVGFVKDSAIFDLCKDGSGITRDTRWTLDYPEDVVFLNAIYGALGTVTLRTAVNYVNVNLHLRALNASRAESAYNYPTEKQKRKWTRVHGEWAIPEGYEAVYCKSGLCLMGAVKITTNAVNQELVSVDGSIIKQGRMVCSCGAGLSSIWTGRARVWDVSLEITS